MSSMLSNGRGVDPATVNYLNSGNVPVSLDRTTGATLTIDRAKTPLVDGIAAFAPAPTAATYVSATSTSTTYVFTSSIDCADYTSLTAWPNVTTSAATTCTWKVQWSMDGTNWFDDPFDSSYGAAASNERIPTVDTITPTFSGAATGFVTALPNARTFTKKARYGRIGQKSAAAATVATNYYYSLL